MYGVSLLALLCLSAPQQPFVLTEDQKVLHTLNRLGFGPRPGEVEQVKKLGLKTYIDQQLHPETLKDEAVEKKTRAFTELDLTAKKLDRLQKLAKGARKQRTKAALEARDTVAQAERQVVVNKLVRAVESEKQLQEVLVDFWSNHFNIDASKARTAKVIDEQQVIRPHVLGKFKDLLSASAHSAAMMLYLDNAQSTAVPLMKKKKKGGLNENYARELMELHTLGVDGGYTQKDVTELARCLTGWGIRGNRYGGEFEFHPALHDRGEKEVLGKKIPAGGGKEEGEQLLEMLASHPSTIRFISTKLCRRFVADEPPKSLIDTCVETWKRTDGDIRELMKTIVTSPEFFAKAAYRSKIKSPFEYVVSATRAVGARFRLDEELPSDGTKFSKKSGGGVDTLTSGQVALLGQPLFHYAFPTGYPEESQKWVSSGALIGRINFALRLTGGKLTDLRVPLPSLAPGATPLDALASQLLGQAPSPTTRATILKQPSPQPRQIAALLLGSPEFQRH